ncbi:CHAT domain-containing protein [Sorangium sp. So ce1504]|uniref:CHAT domain-containing protein n=1 Tax=Sorangium sp. So ce1504 TaxID=3133337 RepID=UPI003F60E110
MPMEIDLTRADAEVRASARWGDEAQSTAHALGADLDIHALSRFTTAVSAAARDGRPLTADLLATAQLLQRAVLAGLDPLRTGIAATPGNPLLVRLCVQDPALQAVPWEALCRPGEAMGFWASSPLLLPVRGVKSDIPWQPRPVRSVRGAVSVLAVAPRGGAGLEALRMALSERIDTGEIEWLPPVVGPAARRDALFDRLGREPIPHVLHFLGHGGQKNGGPVLQLGDQDGEEHWLPVELLAQKLQASLSSFLRLIVLEACEGARPSAFASAAEILARGGADAVVAHLWPVKAHVARACSAEFYRALAAGSQSKGDVAFSMNEARRAILGDFDGSAEAFSPVVYLRRPDNSVIFDFKGRKIERPASRPARPVANGIAPTLAQMLDKPFSLLLGDRFREQRPLLSGFRDKLHKELLKKAPAPAAPGLSMSSLAQRVALHHGVSKLDTAFRTTFRGAPPPPFIDALARVVGSGVHTTLLRHPWLEHAVAEKQPKRPIYVFQQGDRGVLMLCREADSEEWAELDEPPAVLDPEKAIVIFRPYGGFTPLQDPNRPLMTEDDYQLGLLSLGDALPDALVNVIRSTLNYRPTLLVGMSIVTGHHRLLLHRLYPRGVPHGSLAVLDPEDAERELWKNGSGLPGKDEGIEAIESSMEDLAEAFEEKGGS